MDTLFCKDANLDELRKTVTELQVELLKKNILLRECNDNLQEHRKKIVLDLADTLESFHKLWKRIETIHAKGSMDTSSMRFLESFKIVEKQIHNTYQSQGGTLLEVINAIADPVLCEIVDTFPTDDQSLDGIVMNVIARGHMLSFNQIDQVIRPAKVVTYKFVDTH